MSTRDDLLPPEFITELRSLQDEVAPVPWTLVEELLAAELSASLDQVFTQFEQKPLAAASIGQVTGQHCTPVRRSSSRSSGRDYRGRRGPRPPSCGPVENLNPSVRRGCRHNLRHSTVIKSRLTLAFDMQIGMSTAPPLIVSRHPADQAQALNERDR